MNQSFFLHTHTHTHTHTPSTLSVFLARAHSQCHSIDLSFHLAVEPHDPDFLALLRLAYASASATAMRMDSAPSFILLLSSSALSKSARTLSWRRAFCLFASGADASARVACSLAF